MLSAPAGKLPRSSADRSGLGIFVSVLDSSTLEEATNNFSFQEDTQTPCPAQQVSRVRRTMELVVYFVIECPTFWLRPWQQERGSEGSAVQVEEEEEEEEKVASQTMGQRQSSPRFAISNL